MSITSTNCLVLKTLGHGESDKIVTVYAWDGGKIVGIAKGANRSKKRFVNKLEPFSQLDLIYKPSRVGGLALFTDAELTDAFLSLRQNYTRYIAATYVSELTLKFTRQRDTDYELYTLINWAFSALDHGERPLKILSLFHIRLLTVAGYQPQVDYCSQCGSPITPERTYGLVSGSGTLVCSKCNSRQKTSFHNISLQTLSFLRSGMHADLDRILRLQLPDKNAIEILRALHLYSKHLLQQDIHSWKWVIPACFGVK